MNINELLDKAKTLKVQKKLKEDELLVTKNMITLQETELSDCQKARAIVQKVAEDCQKKIEFQISNLVSLALASVFPDPYEFKVSFVQRRNRTECDLLFVKNDEECEPLTAAGGGVVDIASFALRVAIWSLKKTRPTFILDEPAKFVSVDLQSKVSAMLKELSEKLKIQIIMVSHLPEIVWSADKIFRVENIKGESKITVI